MKFTCDRDELFEIISAAEPITGTKTNFSILSNVLLEATEDGKVAIMASNMETTMSGQIPAKIAKAGSITIYQNKLLNIIKQFPPGEVLMELGKNSMVTVKSLDKKRNAQATIIGVGKADFPDIPAFPSKKMITTVDKLYFKRMIQKTIFAVSNDTSQYTLNGILFEIKDSLMKLIAIDGRRLAMINTTLSQKESEELSIIIPQQILYQLHKVLTEEGPIVLAFSDNRVFFKFDSMVLSSNILNGKFPNYNMFIPKKHENKLIASTNEIKSAVSLASVLVDTESNKMIWDVNGNTLKVSAHNTDYGESNEEIFIQYDGKPTKLGINFKLLSEILKEVETEEVEYLFNNALSPVMIQEKNRKEYFYIIMPMKLD